MWVVATEYSLLACLTPSSLALIRSVSRKSLCKTELLEYNTFSAKKKPKQEGKRANKAKKMFKSPLPGIEPGSPA